jgi:UDP-2,4-diacetamido-2,4,6-trideoxy-beta-L-altropyranose hydrolase
VRTVIRADATAQIGAGHVMRCLSLADALKARGGEVLFVAAAMPGNLADRVREAGHGLAAIEPSDLPPPGPGWEGSQAAAADQERDASRTLQAAGGRSADWLVLDHYRFGRDWQQRWKSGSSARILVLDDLANRPHVCEMLVDPTFGRSAEDYRPLVPGGCHVLVGAHYALLRPEFAAARPASLARRREAPGRNLLVSIGATDIGGLTEPVVRAALAADPDCSIDAVVGSGAPSGAALKELAEQDRRVRLHVDSRDMARLLTQADVAIGAAGTSAWERCCLGVPSILLTVAENQRLIVRNLEAIGAVAAVSRWEAAVPAAVGLLADPAARDLMTAAAAAVTDGRGAETVAAVLAGSGDAAPPGVAVRLATPQDSERVWLWRNDPVMRAFAKRHEAVAWADHARWFERVLLEEATVMLIGDVAGDAAGMVRFDRIERARWLVSINVAPRMRGAGVGGALLEQGCRWMDEKHPGAVLEAEIMAGNRASERIFTACGFAPAGGAAEGSYRRFSRAAPEGRPAEDGQ